MVKKMNDLVDDIMDFLHRPKNLFAWQGPFPQLPDNPKSVEGVDFEFVSREKRFPDMDFNEVDAAINDITSLIMAKKHIMSFETEQIVQEALDEADKRS